MSNDGCCAKIRRIFCCCSIFSQPIQQQNMIAQSQITLSNEAIPNPQNSIRLQIRNPPRIANGIANRKWEVITSSAIYEDKTCSICLADQANIKLDCKHYFHGPCLWIWYKTKNSCPNCRSKTDKLDLFCQDCHYQYYVSTLAEAIKEKTHDSYGASIIVMCQNCQNRKKMKQIELEKEQRRFKQLQKHVKENNTKNANQDFNNSLSWF